MSKIQLIIITTLLLVVGVLVYLTVTEVRQRPTERIILKPTMLSEAYSSKEKELFELHIATSTSAFAKELAEVAIEGTSIDIKECVPNPVALHARRGDSVTFNNLSEKPITIFFKGVAYPVEPKASKTTVPLTLGDRYLERMTITYSCEIEGYRSRAGFVYVSP